VYNFSKKEVGEEKLGCFDHDTEKDDKTFINNLHNYRERKLFEMN
jgi:hypothetical protein